MMDHTDTTLRAAIKALEDVVAPAVDPADPLAGQQLRLVVDALCLLRDRLDHLHERYRFELRHYLALARSISADAIACSPAAAAQLEASIHSGEIVLDDAEASDPRLRAAAAGLAAAIRVIVRDAAGATDDARRRIEEKVVSGTRGQIVADRAWHWPQGFDPDPASAQPLQAAFSPQL